MQLFEHQNICLSSFGGTNTLTNLQATHIYLQAKAGDEIPISVLIVSKIATPLKNLMPTPVKHFPHLQGLALAHPIMHSSDFEISLLIGADFYWDIVQDRIICGNGPTAMALKLGYLLSGPVPSQTIDSTFQMFNTLVQPLEALQTLVVEIEAVLNDRPLTYLSADIDDPEPLTPSHLLYGRRITALPHLENKLTESTLVSRSQTSFLAQGVIACSISARTKKRVWYGSQC